MKKKYMMQVIKLILPYKLKIFVIFLCLCLATLINIYLPILNQKIIDEGILKKDLSKLLNVLLLIVFLLFIEQAFNYIQSMISSKISNKINYELLHQAFLHALRLNINYYKTNSYSVVFNNIQYDSSSIARIVNQDTMFLIINIFKISGGIIGLFILSWKLAIFVIALIPIKVFTSLVLIKSFRKISEKLMKQSEFFWRWGEGVLNCIEDVKLWNIYEKSAKEMDSIQTNILCTKKTMAKNTQIFGSINILIQVLMQNTIYFLGGVLIFKEEFSLGGLVAFLTYASTIMQTVQFLMSVGHSFSESLPSFERYDNFMNEPTEQIMDQRYLIQKVKAPDKIVFKDVFFSYDKQVNVLNSINLEIYKGEKIGLIGNNGSGKSSLINLLLRFYQPSKGAIFIDDKSIDEFEIDSYREMFSVMKQQPHLFNKSIKDNINMTGNLSEYEIMNYCDNIGLNEFIEEFPLKLETIVGANGSKLSGGQRQKIALTRSLLKDSSILILDEATSNFDYDSEMVFNQMIEKSRRYDYLIVISHQKEILEKMDKIIWLNKGSIEAVGKYEEIMPKYISEIS